MGYSMVKKYLLFLIFLIISIALYRAYGIPREWKTITLGASLPLSGINKELGREVKEGADSYFRYISEHGGVHGQPITLIAHDDQYEPQKTFTNTEAFIADPKIFALFGFVGTPTTKRVLPLIDSIPLIAPYTGAAFLRDPQNTTVVNFRSSYDEEVENIVRYLYQHKKVRKFAIFYQNDAYGIAGYNATISALKKRHLPLTGEGTYRRNTLSIQHALHEIGRARPEAIILVGAYKPSAHFIRVWRERYSENTMFAPISFVNANALIRELDHKGSNIYFSLTVPSYEDEHLEVANAYQKLLRHYHPSSRPSYASFESFLAAKATVAALQSIQGAITRPAFLQALQHLDADAIGDIPLRYHKMQLLNQVYLSVYHDGAFHTLRRKKP